MKPFSWYFHIHTYNALRDETCCRPSDYDRSKALDEKRKCLFWGFPELSELFINTYCPWARLHFLENSTLQDAGGPVAIGVTKLICKFEHNNVFIALSVKREKNALGRQVHWFHT